MKTFEWICKFTGAVILAILAVIDVRTKKIPLLLPLILGGLTILLWGIPIVRELTEIESVENGIFACAKAPSVTDAALSSGLDVVFGMFPGIVVFAVSLISKGQIGLGDSVLLLAVGGILGGVESMEVFILSLVFVFVFSCVGLVLKKLSRTSRLPFVPFYFVAYVGVVYL